MASGTDDDEDPGPFGGGGAPGGFGANGGSTVPGGNLPTPRSDAS